MREARVGTYFGMSNDEIIVKRNGRGIGIQQLLKIGKVLPPKPLSCVPKVTPAKPVGIIANNHEGETVNKKRDYAHLRNNIKR